MMAPAPSLLTFTLVTCFLLTLTSALRVIDMTYSLADASIVWPNAPKFNFTILNRGLIGDKTWMEANFFATPEHKSTHVDAPAHFHKNGWRSHQVPASHLVGPAIVVDISSKAATDPDYLMTVQDLQDWEAQQGRIPDGAIVIMNSGWGARYPDPKRVFSTDDPTDFSTFHFPSVHPNAALWLVQNRDVRAVGVDTPSTDSGTSTTFDTHKILGRHGVIGIENLMNVGLLPPRGATVVVGLIKLEDGSGGPARILALLDLGQEAAYCDCATGHVFALVMTVLVVLVVFLACKVFFQSS